MMEPSISILNSYPSNRRDVRGSPFRDFRNKDKLKLLAETAFGRRLRPRCALVAYGPSDSDYRA